jgi:formylglycine-generating enzyme required for sulfatase activity
MNQKLVSFILCFIIILVFAQVSGKAETASGSKTDLLESKLNLPREIICRKDNSKMILIPGGNFIYGIQEEDRERILKVLKTAQLKIFELEFVEKIVNIPAYYIDKFETTNAQYAQFTKETGHRKPHYWSWRIYNRPDQPVIGITWADAEAYAKWAGKQLPSEEQWEKAARGVDGRLWPWGNEPSGKKYNGKAQGNLKPVAVGSYPAGSSPYGLMDMAGNVYEMTTGIWAGTRKAMRGGCYLNSGAYVRTMFRWASGLEDKGTEYLGFRCIMDVEQALKSAKGAKDK